MFNCKNNYCVNCGKIGHSYKRCIEPIMSLGIIAFKIDFKGLNKFLKKIKKVEINIDYIKNIEENNNILRMNTININYLNYYNELKKYIYFLLISRRNSLGLMEIMRGHYAVNNKNSIVKLYKQLYNEEVDIIKNNSFENIWKYTWQSNNIDNDYIISKQKFDTIKEQGIFDYCIKKIKVSNNNYEWGFPKGRRSNMEKNLECAIREFKEETSLNDKEFEIINNIDPVTENLIGTNNINYKHIYYFSICKFEQKVEINQQNKNQKKEVGKIDWFNYDDTIKLIRNYHLNKKIIINNIFIYLCNLILNNN